MFGSMSVLVYTICCGERHKTAKYLTDAPDDVTVRLRGNIYNMHLRINCYPFTKAFGPMHSQRSARILFMPRFLFWHANRCSVGKSRELYFDFHIYSFFTCLTANGMSNQSVGKSHECHTVISHIIMDKNCLENQGEHNWNACAETRAYHVEWDFPFHTQRWIILDFSLVSRGRFNSTYSRVQTHWNMSR